MDEPILEKWLVEQGMEHDNERYLLETMCQKLRQNRVFRPAIGTLEGIVGYIKELLEAETYQWLSFLWKDEFLKKLDLLLEVDKEKNYEIDATKYPKITLFIIR